MDALFGKERATALRQRLQPMRPYAREATIVEELSQAIKGLGFRYVLPFCFKDESGNRTSHHLIFVSKNFKAYEIMKEIMAEHSSLHQEGVASFEYLPTPSPQGLLFELNRPLLDLESLLLADFDGQRLTMNEIFERHNVDRPYTRKNYKAVLIAMEKKELIRTIPPANARRANTFADATQVIFPKR
jgi:hypothetical protein